MCVRRYVGVVGGSNPASPTHAPLGIALRVAPTVLGADHGRMSSIPVSASSEAVVGWRAWNLTDDDDAGPMLWPTGSGVDPWPHRRPTEARCAVPFLLRGPRPHDAPNPECRCGIYAARSLQSVGTRRPAWPPPPVIGRASLWGALIEHELGWRGQFGYPNRLGLACVMCAWFESGRGGVAVVHTFGRRLYTLCDRHRGGIEVPDGRRTRPSGIDPRALHSRLLDAYAVDLLPAERLEPLYRRSRAAAAPSYVPSIRAVPLGDA